ALLREDERVVGTARADPARRPARSRAVEAARRAGCARRREAGAEHRDDRAGDRAARRARVSRLPAERTRQAAGLAVLRETAARRAGVDAARVGRSKAGARHPALHDTERRNADEATRPRSAARCAGDEAGPDECARATRAEAVAPPRAK